MSELNCLGFLPAFFALLSFASLASADVVINEVHYDPDVKTEPAEFVELYNAGASSVDLSGWHLSGGVSFLFPNGTSLGAGRYLVIAKNPPTILSKFGGNALGPWLGALNNNGDQIQLLNASGGVEDEVDYQLGFPWPTVGDPPGYSIELINPEFDNNLGGNWRASVQGNPATQTQTLIATNSTWRYFKGLSEPSNPRTAWRMLAFDDSSWAEGAAPIGYDPAVPMATPLSDMRGGYTTVYFRKTFLVDDVSAISGLVLQALYDDGFKIWINGQAVSDGKFNMASGEQPYTATAATAIENNSYRIYSLESPQSYLVKGQNILAVQAANSSLSASTDFFLALGLQATTGPASHGPTPGARNSVFSTNAPPQIRQVEHHPDEPRSNEPVRITAKITDPEAVQGVVLQYQAVAPGSYVELADPGYAQNWVSIPMNDAGVNGDEQTGDSVYTATIPANVQVHRQLVRYRVRATDALGASVTVPYPDDPQPNFAYFCYDGVPAWRAAVRPGSTPVLDFGTNVMRHLPAIHLISKKAEVEDATWLSRYAGDAYLWTGTLVYDGKVYDHIHFRARGGVWRYAMVKNMWKFDFNRGHGLEMRDDYGKKYKVTWTKLNLGASIQQGDYDHRGEQGMFESVGFHLFNLAGVEVPRTTFVQFRVIDEAEETSSSTQYEGDFWGVYLAVEQEDGRFLDAHDLPDGNFYKMEGGTGELNNLGPLGPMDKSDLNVFLNAYRNSSTPATEAWWRANLSLSNYWSYQAIVQGIHHYDICYDKNYFYYRNPETRLWSVHSWDLDLTWANNMYDSGCGGVDDLYQPVFGGGSYPVKPALMIEYRNRVREISDLLFNTDQASQVIDEHAELLRGTGTGVTILDADRCQWDYNPKMTNSAYSSSIGKAGQGRFYQWPREPSVSKDFSGCVQLMKNYVVARGGILANLASDALIPATPVLNYIGPGNYSLTGIRFRCSDYSGSNPFAALKWRVAEVWNTNAPAYRPGDPRPYEITPVWETGEITAFANEVAIPASALKVGHTYRARARMKDTTGRWSSWSAPAQFTAGLPDNAEAIAQSLKITELMYDPPGGGAYEFIELHNSSATDPLALDGVKFTSGVDYTFPTGVSLPPLGYLLVIRETNQAAFRAYYHLGHEVPLAGPYSGNLANGGEQLTLKTGAGGLDIFSFEYSNGRGWPVAAEGAGHSLVPLGRAVGDQATGSLDYAGNWRASTFVKGSPGRADPPPPAPPLVLNEVMAHTDYSDPARPEYDSNDWIELYNPSSTNVVLQDWYLSDDPAQPRKWPIPSTTVPPGGHVSFDEVTGFHSPITSGFGLDKAGEQVLLSHMAGGAEDRVVDAVSFKGQENFVSLSRFPDGGAWWGASKPTRGARNTAWLSRPVINEIMYHPPDPNPGTNNTWDEYLEVLNPTTTSVTFADANGVWRLDGGVAFVFPAGISLGPGSVLLVVNFDPNDAPTRARFVETYHLTNAVTILGPYGGSLGNRSERVAIEKPQYPDLPGQDYSWIIVDEVIYGNQDPWPTNANGGGYALQRMSATGAGNDPENWVAALPTPGVHQSSGPVDRDGDGMPDEWEMAWSLNPDDPSDALQDADGDGMSNLAEYLSGTDPRNPASRLALDANPTADGPVALSFIAQPGRTYTIQFRGNAAEGSWEKLADVPAQSAAETISVTDTNGGFESRFYRVVTPALP